MQFSIPVAPEELTPELLTTVAQQQYPGVKIDEVSIVKTYQYGDGEVSTSPRVALALKYAPGTPDCYPNRVIVKMSFDDSDPTFDTWNTTLVDLFANEVKFYNRIRPSLDVEAPHSLGGYFDPVSKRYLLILEDIRERGATFPTILEDRTVAEAGAVLDTHAKLHASLWDSPRFQGDLSWVETHLEGGVEKLMRSQIPDGVKDQLARFKFKRDIVGRLWTSADDLLAGMCAVKQYQAKLPQALLHGDSHIGNTYKLPDGTGGLIDWQLCVRGYAMHDVTYTITTSLPVEVRREKERELLAFYRDRLGHYGVASPPSLDTLFHEHRIASLWPLYIGWLTCPVENYGWDTVVTALQRVSAAFEDHETRKLVTALM